jgi:UDP-N-acetylmuramate dehydrogenase
VTILEDVSLAQYTTLGVGGAARWFVETGDPDAILAAIAFARARAVPHFILGGGSNLLVSDQGFPGIVVRIAGAELHWMEDHDGHARIEAAAGVVWDSVVRLAVERGSAGIECLAGIPGSAGGTPVQNVGAYGQEVSRTIATVRAVDLSAGKVVDLAAADCGFGYRRSLFNTTQQGRYAITQVVYRLAAGGEPLLAYRDVKRYFAERGVPRPSLAETADAVRAIRAEKGMLAAQGGEDSRSAGSFFKNPVVPAHALARLASAAGCAVDEVPQFPAGWGYSDSDGMVKVPAAWLIERAGFAKGFAMGRAALSSRHVLAIVNRGGATAAEIVALRDAVQREVRARFAITLEQEPVMLGF